MARTRLYPPSVDPGFPRLPKTPEGWTSTTFGEVLEPVERPLKLDPDRTYQLVTAKRSRGGIVSRGTLLGREILTKTQFEAKAGDFLISRRQIIHGACGVVPPELDGAVVSNEYSILKTGHGLLMDFLRHYSHTPYFQRTCFHASHGVDVEKMIFKLEEWLRMQVDLPPIREQGRIAAILSSIDSFVAATEAVTSQLETVKREFVASAMTHGSTGRAEQQHTPLGKIPTTWRVVELGTILESLDSGWSPQCHSVPAMLHEWGVLKVSAVSWGEFRPHENKRLPGGVAPRPSAEVRKGDILLSRANTPELVGRSVLVRSTRPRLMLSDKILRLKTRPEIMAPRFLNLVLQSAPVRQQIEAVATGSSRSMKNVSQEKLRNILVPIPSLAEQAGIADLSDILGDRLERELAALQQARVFKMALLPALLTGEVRVPVRAEEAP